MIGNFIYLIGSYMPIMEKYGFHILAFMLIVTVPCVIRELVRWD